MQNTSEYMNKNWMDEKGIISKFLLIFLLVQKSDDLLLITKYPTICSTATTTEAHQFMATMVSGGSHNLPLKQWNSLTSTFPLKNWHGLVHTLESFPKHSLKMSS